MAKGLSYFETFDAERYFQKKIIKVMKSETWKDFNTQEVIGSKYTVIVWEDKTEYSKEGVSNVGDTYTVKVKDKEPKNISSPIDAVLINPQARVFGDFRNELSVTADDIKLHNQVNK
ncbi:hypothetical protein [uncultured Vagococcus sp.]|uniref:hypothetical protein n=1 Tax=uncultured Vagococcus sp. TaxID=189676 RepID=UPI00258A205A|nr:hypothetical protein [uncultured Vagococcus sp.]